MEKPESGKSCEAGDARECEGGEVCEPREGREAGGACEGGEGAHEAGEVCEARDAVEGREACESRKEGVEACCYKAREVGETREGGEEEENPCGTVHVCP